ncbi:MAG TPA: hypothetical protein VJS15_07250, partial [Allosphingosinicella sp.]|nr:hypothetical protein [Allosphingosinicella sp.]
MKGRHRIGAAALLLGLAAAPVFASGGSEPSPRYIDHHGGTPAELGVRYRGRVGVVMAASHAPMLYLQWRLLHGLAVGGEAGAALSEPCCNIPWRPNGVEAWLQERSRVLGAPDTLYYIPTDRPGPDYSTIPNCFPEAFDTAAATLRDRAARHGPTEPAVRAWL